MEQVMWTQDYEDDIASDLSAFHRVDDPMTIDGPRYFMLAARLPAYTGVVAARVEKLRQDEREAGRSPHSAAQPHSTPEKPMRVSDDVALATLAAEGWAERSTTEERV